MSRTDIEPNTTYDQYWDDFDNIYIDFALEYTQQLLTLQLSLSTFASFPFNLPQKLILPILAYRYKVHNDECERRNLKGDLNPEIFLEMDEIVKQLTSEPLDEFQAKIGLIFDSIQALSRWGKKLDYQEFPNFERVIITQHIITICSFAESFYSNAVRYFAMKPPYPLARWQREQPSRRRMSSMTSMELLDQYILDMGRGEFHKRLKMFQEKHSVQFSITIAQEEDLQNLFLVRNHLVHNAGRVGEFFITKTTRWSTLSHGDLVPLQPQTIEELIDTLVDVVVEVYRCCSLQLLGKSNAQLVWGSKRI